MSTIKLTQANVRTLAVWFRARITQCSAVVFARRNEPQRHALPVAQPHADAVARAERLFAQAVQENSNLELDWLWCATNMISVAQQRYCFERALHINPASDLAQRALAKLPQDAPAAAVAVMSPANM